MNRIAMSRIEGLILDVETLAEHCYGKTAAVSIYQHPNRLWVVQVWNGKGFCEYVTVFRRTREGALKTAKNQLGALKFLRIASSDEPQGTRGKGLVARALGVLGVGERRR